MSEKSSTASLFQKVAHIGIAVRDGEKTAALMSDVLGAVAKGTTVSEERGIKITFLDVGGTSVELLEPARSDSQVSKFLETRGEGFHHIAFEVPNIQEALANLRKASVKLIEPAPSKGTHGSLVAFIHPSSMNGVLVELCETQQQD